MRLAIHDMVLVLCFLDVDASLRVCSMKPYILWFWKFMNIVNVG